MIVRYRVEGGHITSTCAVLNSTKCTKNLVVLSALTRGTRSRPALAYACTRRPGAATIRRHVCRRGTSARRYRLQWVPPPCHLTARTEEPHACTPIRASPLPAPPLRYTYRYARARCVPPAVARRPRGPQLHAPRRHIRAPAPPPHPLPRPPRPGSPTRPPPRPPARPRAPARPILAPLPGVLGHAHKISEVAAAPNSAQPAATRAATRGA